MNEEAHQTFATDGGNLWDIFEQIFVKLKMGKPWAAWAAAAVCSILPWIGLKADDVFATPAPPGSP